MLPLMPRRRMHLMCHIVYVLCRRRKYAKEQKCRWTKKATEPVILSPLVLQLEVVRPSAAVGEVVGEKWSRGTKFCRACGTLLKGA